MALITVNNIEVIGSMPTIDTGGNETIPVTVNTDTGPQGLSLAFVAPATNTVSQTKSAAQTAIENVLTGLGYTIPGNATWSWWCWKG